MDKLMEVLNSVGGYTVVLATALELGFRMVKSEKPLSIAYAIAKGAHGLAAVAEKFADLLDKVLPQKLK